MIAFGWWLALATLARAQAPGPVIEHVFPYDVHSHTLDNGLNVYLVPMDSPGVVACYTWVKVGSGDEVDPGHTGFAHFFEHLMFKGTEAVPEQVREQRLLRMGAEENAWTWFDETVFHAVLSADHLHDFLDLEADRFQHLALTPDEVRTEAGAVYGEFRKGQADPDTKLSEAVRAAAFTVHPYGHDTIGYEADIEAMPGEYDYARAFFDRFYRPENTNLVVVGDVDPAQALAWIEQGWGGWQRGTQAPPQTPTEPPQEQERDVRVDWPTPTAPRLSLNWKIPASNPDDPDVAALEMVQDLLLSDVGPLQRRLVREQLLAYSVHGGRGDEVDPDLFTIDVVARDAKDLDAIQGIVREEIGRLAEGVDLQRLEQARSHARYAFLSALDDPGTVASRLGWMIRRGGPDAIDRFYTRYDAVGPEDVARAARTYLVDAHLTRGILVHTPAEVK